MFGLGDSFVFFSLDQAVELVMNICEYKVLDEILKDISDFTQYVERLKLRLFQMSARGEEFIMEAGIANEIFRLVKPDLELTPDIKKDLAEHLSIAEDDEDDENPEDDIPARNPVLQLPLVPPAAAAGAPAAAEAAAEAAPEESDPAAAAEAAPAAAEAAPEDSNGNSAGEIVELRPDADEHFDLPANA